MPKNQGLYLYFTLKSKQTDTLLWTFTRRYENPKKLPPFFINSQSYLGLLFDIKWTNFLSNINSSLITKTLERKFLEFFQHIAFFFKVEKSRLSPFLCLVFLADDCQVRARIPIFGPLDWQLSKMAGNSLSMNRDVNLQGFLCSCTLCVPAMFQDVGRLRQD